MNTLRRLDSIRRHARCAIVLLIVGLIACAVAVPPLQGKDENENKAIVKYTNEIEGKNYIADLLWGIDIDNGKFQDTRTASLKVGIFAEEDKEGSLKNIRYEKKVIYPDKDYKQGSVKIVLRGNYYKDLTDSFNKKFKTSKATKDEMLRRQKLLRLMSWCDAHFLPDLKQKVEKELKKVDPDVVEEEASEGFFKRTEEQEKLVAVLNELKDIEDVALASSEHITVASDFLPPKTIERMLKTGERIHRDFLETMYVDGVKDLRDFPQGEICRIYYLTHTTTLEEALQNASKLGPGLGDMKHKESVKMSLILGGQNMSATDPKTRKVIKISFSALETRDRDNYEDLSRIASRPPSADYTNRMVSTLADALMDNWLGNPPAYQGRITMPWLSEGFSHYLCIKNLGVLGSFTTDFDFSYAWREVGFGYRWVGDIEETMHRVAQDPTTDKLEDLFRIAHYRNLKTESVAKSVSLIDFLMESNKVGFLNFLKDLQKHYRKLDKTGNQQAFIDGLSPIIAENLGEGSTSDTGMSSRLKKRSLAIDSVEGLESAWRDWASRWVSGKR